MLISNQSPARTTTPTTFILCVLDVLAKDLFEAPMSSGKKKKMQVQVITIVKYGPRKEEKEDGRTN